VGAKSVFKLSLVDVERLVRKRAALTANVRLTNHVLARMKLRHIAREEVYDVLCQGRLARPPEPNAALGSLECRMQRFMSGRELAVVAAISDDDPMVIVVTAIVLDKGN
jgi:hypothetical protein